MPCDLQPILVSFGFLIINVIILLIILYFNGRTDSKTTPSLPLIRGIKKEEGFLDASNILNMEFNYACTTASEAMNDRHTMINYYLLVTGVVASGTVAVLAKDSKLPEFTATVLLWLLCCVGWFYFLKLIRLRQAWHDSLLTMNRIKEFYILHAKDFDYEVLSNAFLWKTQTLPPPDKPWTLFFFSAMLIGFLDSAAYVAGEILISPEVTKPLDIGVLTLFGLVFFAFHAWLYFAFLKSKPNIRV